jgi:hypothetical protein
MSDTGYVRMSYAQLQKIYLTHLVSGVDEDGPESPFDSASATAITGYTEWVSQGGLTVTVGWDWRMVPNGNALRLRRLSEPSSNLMLQDTDGGDLGPVKTAALLETFIDGFNWQDQTLEYINIRYAS